ncbi:hypothetical protein Droror1_Dr00023486 [Drosera rotundifolia]
MGEDVLKVLSLLQVPHVTRTDYELIDICEDDFVSLLTKSGGTKEDLRLPTDEPLLTQVNDYSLSFVSFR